MIIYLIKSTICLALLIAFYYLFLEKERMHRFNRFYLLGSLLFAFLIPLFVITIEELTIADLPGNNMSNGAETAISNLGIIFAGIANYAHYLIGFYLLIGCLFLIRFGKHLYDIIHKIRNINKVIYRNAILVLLPEKILPYTFWNYIFISKDEYASQTIEQELLTHELTHVSQKHTLDILIIESLQIIFWFNPLLILLKKAIRLNHEFLADQTVTRSHKNISAYQHLLLNKTTMICNHRLASGFNYSITKKRLIMMAAPISSLKILVKKLAIIPLLVTFTFLFASKVGAGEKASSKEVQKESYEPFSRNMPPSESLFTEGADHQGEHEGERSDEEGEHGDEYTEKGTKEGGEHQDKPKEGAGEDGSEHN